MQAQAQEEKASSSAPPPPVGFLIPPRAPSDRKQNLIVLCTCPSRLGFLDSGGPGGPQEQAFLPGSQPTLTPVSTGHIRDGQDPEAWSHAAISMVLGGLGEFGSAPGPASDGEDGLVQLRTSGLLHRLLTDLIPGLGGVPMVAERPAQASLGQATQPRGAGQRGPQASGGFWTSREDSGF